MERPHLRDTACTKLPPKPTFFRMNGQPLGHRSVAVILVLPVLAATVLPPLFDTAAGGSVPQAESEHDPATCAVLHDHATCTQLTKSFGQLSWGWAPFRDLNLGLRNQAMLQKSTWVHRSDYPAPSPRGPPIYLT